MPFKVTGDAFTNLLGGQIDFMSVDSTWAKSRPKVRILAVAAAKRSPTLPEIPTLAEAGVAGVDVRRGGGGGACGHASPDHRKARRLVQPDHRKRGDEAVPRSSRVDPFPGSPEQMAALLKTEMIAGAGSST